MPALQQIYSDAAEDYKDSLQYTGFESDFAKDILTDQLRLTPETVVFYEDGKLLLKSRAVLAILKYTSRPYRWLRIFRLLPITLLDRIYEWIARNRYSWFGQSPECFIPDDNYQAKFLA